MVALGNSYNHLRYLAVVLPLVVLPLRADAEEMPHPVVDAGHLLHELEPERHITPAPKEPEVEIKAPKLSRQGSEAKVMVKSIAFRWLEEELLQKKPAVWYQAHGKTELERLDELAHGMVNQQLGKEFSFNELVGLAEQVTLKLREEGYPTAIVYMPQQNMENGCLAMQVIMGSYNRIEFDNQSMLTDARLKGLTYELQKGGLIANDELNKALLNLNDIPGMQVRATLEPGEDVGTAILRLSANCLEKQELMLYVDNWGSKSTGRYRYGAHYHYNNVSRVGDQLQLNYMLTNERDMDNYHAQYELPLGRDGAKWRMGVSKLNYELGDKHRWMDADGSSITWETGFTVPMERTLHYSNFYDVAYRHRKIEDNMFNGIYSAKKSSDAVDVTLKGYKTASTDSLSYSLTGTVGKLYMDSEQAKVGDAYDTAGWFQKSGADFYWIHNFSDVTSLHLFGSGQWSWKHNLDSSEDFYIGGPTAVRAFPTGEASGDWGVLGTAELHYQTDTPGLQLVAFYDIGYVRYNTEDPFNDDAHSRTLAGAGVGLVYSKSRDCYIKVDYAVPLSDKYSQSFGRINKHMLWFRAVKQY